MSFSTRFIAVIAATVVSTTAAQADGHISSLLSNFSIGGFSTGDIVVNGSPTTVINAAKDGFNDSQISLDVIGEGCGVDCTDVVGNAITSVYELAFVRADTVGDTAGDLFGSSTLIDLSSGAELQVAGTLLRDTSNLTVSGDAYGVATGDNVSVVAFQDAFGKVQNDMTFHGPICPDGVCGLVTQGAWIMGGMSQAVHTTASGQGAIAISNVTSSNVAALLNDYKEIGVSSSY